MLHYNNKALKVLINIVILALSTWLTFYSENVINVTKNFIFKLAGKNVTHCRGDDLIRFEGQDILDIIPKCKDDKITFQIL